MVERLCRDYGTPLVPLCLPEGTPTAGEAPLEQQQQQQQPLELYAFPTLEQLSAATEDQLRAAGFGYR